MGLDGALDSASLHVPPYISAVEVGVVVTVGFTVVAAGVVVVA